MIFRDLVLRGRALLKQQRVERELDDELAFHAIERGRRRDNSPRLAFRNERFDLTIPALPTSDEECDRMR